MKPQVTAPATPGPQVDPVTGRVMEPMKAPNSWTPALREKWVGVDPLVQKFLLDRDRDMSMQLQQTAEARKLHKEFNEITAPMQELMKQNGWNAPITEVTKQLFEMSYVLNTGSPQQKAQVFYNLISHFKPDAQTLSALFDGQQVNVQPMAPAPQPQEIASPSREELLEEARTEEAITAFGTDPANEWFNDVRGQMGQIIMAGLVDTSKPVAQQLKDAYDLAVSRHPEISHIVASRASTQPARQVPSQAVAPTATPVRSVKPSLGSGRQSSAPKKYKSSREAAMEAYEELMAANR